MTKGIIISLYEYTGTMLEPWAKDGYTCYAYDLQHDEGADEIVRYEGEGSITFRHANLHSAGTLYRMVKHHKKHKVDMVFGFPVCTDLAVSGAAHFERKRKVNPFFQLTAAHHAKAVSDFAEAVGAAAYMIENPVSTLATLWRKPDHYFHPWQFGGYLDYKSAKHPVWPEYIADWDIYNKKTCLWVGGIFTMPKICAMDTPEGYSTQHKKLGGKSMKTKNIRSATPRGFAAAVHYANRASTDEIVRPLQLTI